MRRLLLVVVTMWASVASAAPCTVAGKPLLVIDQSAPPTAHLATAVTTLYENGAWRTEVTDRKGRRARTETACLAAAELDRIHDAVRTAAWTVVGHQPPCRKDSPRSTAYRWNGRLIHTARSCGGDVLDDSSRRTLDDMEVLLSVPDDLDGGSRGACADNPLAAGCR